METMGMGVNDWNEAWGLGVVKKAIEGLHVQGEYV